MTEPKNAPHRAVLAKFMATPIIRSVLELLEKSLSPDLTYHSHHHTREVLEEVLRFGVHDGLKERELWLLAVAAAFHDTGFLRQRFHNEQVGASLAVESMKADSDFQSKEIELVHQMILDTRLNLKPSLRLQEPHTYLSPYLLDADLGNFGRDDFFEKGELERRERGVDDSEFLSDVLALLLRHDWLTPAAKSLRSEGKRKNIETIRRMLAV